MKLNKFLNEDFSGDKRFSAKCHFYSSDGVTLGIYNTQDVKVKTNVFSERDIRKIIRSISDTKKADAAYEKFYEKYEQVVKEIEKEGEEFVAKLGEVLYSLIEAKAIELNKKADIEIEKILKEVSK